MFIAANLQKTVEFKNASPFSFCNMFHREGPRCTPSSHKAISTHYLSSPVRWVPGQQPLPSLSGAPITSHTHTAERPSRYRPRARGAPAGRPAGRHPAGLRLSWVDPRPPLPAARSRRLAEAERSLRVARPTRLRSGQSPPQLGERQRHHVSGGRLAAQGRVRGR